MKKFLWILCVVLAMASLNACGKDEGVGLNEEAKLNKVSNKWKKNAVKEVADQLHELVDDEVYMEEVLGHLGQYRDELKDVEIDESESAVVYTVTKKAVRKLVNEEIHFNDLSDAAKQFIYDSGVSFVGSAAASMLGTQGQLVYSGLSATKMFAIDKAFDNQVWFIPTNDESVYIMATLISKDDLYPLCSISCRYICCEGNEDFLDNLKEEYSEHGLEPDEIAMK